jgi:hypothetical protein
MAVNEQDLLQRGPQMRAAPTIDISGIHLDETAQHRTILAPPFSWSDMPRRT